LSETPSATVSLQFSEALLRAVDDALVVPGEVVRKAIYQHLEDNYEVRREEIPEKLDTFHKAKQAALGKAASVLGRMIARNLYAHLGLNFREYANWTLIEYVDDAKKKLGRKLT